MNVAYLWRYPIKALGREAIQEVHLKRGKTMPFDRVWAVLHDNARIDADAPEWARCANFSRAASSPGLMAITARLDETTGTVTLTHPNAPTLTINPDLPQDATALIDWVRPLCDPDRPTPVGIYKAPDRGMTDSAFPSISLNTIGSLNALSEAANSDLSPHRFRGNIWIGETAPWAEFDWVGKEIQIGAARLKVVERIERCLATSANPDTGNRDLDVLNALNSNWGHQDFGVCAEVIESGPVHLGDQVIL